MYVSLNANELLLSALFAEEDHILCLCLFLNIISIVRDRAVLYHHKKVYYLNVFKKPCHFKLLIFGFLKAQKVLVNC